MSTIQVKVLLFASAREAAGNLSETFITLDNGATISDFRRRMAEKVPTLSDFVLDEESSTLALNEEYVQSGDVIHLKNGDVIALIPPISGG